LLNKSKSKKNSGAFPALTASSVLDQDFIAALSGLQTNKNQVKSEDFHNLHQQLMLGGMEFVQSFVRIGGPDLLFRFLYSYRK
jgi:hypothetical protein